MNFRSLLEFPRLLLGGRTPRTPDAVTIAAARRVALGSSYIEMPGWLATDRDVLDITQREAFARYWTPGTVEAFVAEHVWEHLPAAAAAAAVPRRYDPRNRDGTLRYTSLILDGVKPR